MELDVFEFFLSTLCFLLAILLSPVLFFSYLFVKITHSVWYRFISFLHPELEFIRNTTLRTLSDTHRNQGVITVLLTVKGSANFDGVKRHLQEVVKRKDKLGNLVFPHLRQVLDTRFGTYAWRDINNFQLEQNLILAPFIFKGRSISEINIQDCVSDIVSKYLPSSVPPWQLVIIPSSEHQHYILLRVHHVLLGDNLNLADLLPIIPPVRSNITTNIHTGPLYDVVRPVEHIYNLTYRFTEDLTNRWNEFISNYDPLEKHELLKRTPGFFEFIAISIITSVSCFKEYRKGLGIVKNDFASKLNFLTATIDRECSKRRLTLSNFGKSILVTLHPTNIVTVIIKNIWNIVIKPLLKAPVTIYREFMALVTCINLQYCDYPNTTIGFMYIYVPLIYYAAKELFYYGNMLFHGPKNLIKEGLSSADVLQTITLCGRKVVAWSSPAKVTVVREIAKRTKCSETEIVLAACSVAVARFCKQNKDITPTEIAVTTRHVNSNYVFATGQNVKSSDSMGGMVCLSLPIIGQDVPLLENLLNIKKSVANSMSRQPLIYLLSLLNVKYQIFSRTFPETFVGIFLRCLSLKYTVAYTELSGRHANIGQCTMWGQDVKSAIYWRPPQSNMSISLCLNQYGEDYIMGVMCDAQIVPNHTVLARNFLEHIRDLATASGI